MSLTGIEKLRHRINRGFTIGDTEIKIVLKEDGPISGRIFPFDLQIGKHIEINPFLGIMYDAFDTGIEFPIAPLKVTRLGYVSNHDKPELFRIYCEVNRGMYLIQLFIDTDQMLKDIFFCYSDWTCPRKYSDDIKDEYYHRNNIHIFQRIYVTHINDYLINGIQSIRYRMDATLLDEKLPQYNKYKIREFSSDWGTPFGYWDFYAINIKPGDIKIL